MEQNKTSKEEANAQGIRAVMCDRIKGEFDRLITKQIDPWIFFNNKGFLVKKFNGKTISYPGVEYSGSSLSQFFWEGYIQPFIEDVIKRTIKYTIELAKEKGVSISAVLYSTQANLSGGIDAVFKKMQDIDRRLQGKGNPKNVPKRDISIEVKQMDAYLDKQIENYRNLAFETPKGWFLKWYEKSPHIKWLIGIIISVLALIFSACAVIFSILSRK